MIDSALGTSIRGAEDLVLDSGNNRVIFSAYDRIGVEQAVRNRDSHLPPGGLYGLTLTPGWQKRTRVEVDALVTSEGRDADFHPHGIDLRAFSNGMALLAAVNRSYVKDGPRTTAPWNMVVTLDLFDASRIEIKRIGRIGMPELCRANDVVVLDRNSLALTTDRRACGGMAGYVENAMGLKTGTVRLINISRAKTTPVNLTEIANEIGFANGIIGRESDGGATIYVAATREKSLIEMHVRSYSNYFRKQTNRSAMTEIDKTVYKLPASPDNLSAIKNGNIIFAAHPKIFRFAAYRYNWMWTKTAPSLIFEYEPSSNRLTKMFEDKSGELFSGATVGLRIGDVLLAGSVADTGILVCTNTKNHKGQ